MQKNKAKETVHTKKISSKIGLLILAISLVTTIILGTILALHTPDVKSALLKTTNKKINSACIYITVENSANISYSKYTIDQRNNTIHVTTKNNSKSDTSSELWANNQYLYYRYNKGNWNRVKQGKNVNDVYLDYKKLYTTYNFKYLSDTSFKYFTLKSDGLNGYVISYSGNNEEIIKTMQKITPITTASDPESSNVKNISLQVKTNRNCQLTELYYKIVYFDKKDGRFSLHLYNVNNVSNLSIPSSVMEKFSISKSH